MTHIVKRCWPILQSLYGPSPIIVQTSGGYHAWYKHRGERRLIRPDPDKPIDILGGGFVIAPPPLHRVLDDLRWPRMCEGDGRYVEMRRACQREARYVDSAEALLDWALTRNLDFMEPLSDREVMHAVDWAWTVQTEGHNWAGNQQIAIAAHD